ncbi:hypothetical protein PM030_17315 [Halorubrum ezzemoulense]|uniref:hypothetical protein n=1 Tax=Halorubrum ezzemoulense TaxID=337243 RepID=UPI00232ECED7|nr:hypothetical protein [Halorubrum ezzemoulense]MDB2283595.1 hypothetical protein [Halorubrum ezzemoulense]
MSKHQPISMRAADVLAETSAFDDVTHARESGRPGVQLRCRVNGEPTDVTIVTSSQAPQRAVRAASAATQRDARHAIVARNKRLGALVTHWLRSPVAEATGDSLQFYTGTATLEHDDAVVVTASETAAPAWWVCGTTADADRDRRYELRSAGDVLATAVLEDESLTLKHGSWTDVEQERSPTDRPAVTPAADYQAASETTTWTPVKCPLTVEPTAPLTESTVYALSDGSDDGVTTVAGPSERGDSADTEANREIAALVDRLLAQYTVESPGAGIDYDEFVAVVSRHREAEGRPPVYKNLLGQALGAKRSLTIERVMEAGGPHRQLRGCAWAVPPSTAGE